MKIAVVGFGIEGKSSYKYFSSRGHDVTIVDERTDIEVPVGAMTKLGAEVMQSLDGFDMVIRTAGLAPSKIHTDGKIWSATNEFFAQCPAPIIGVTGTKGKGTTASLITSILKAAGKTVHLVGNIGTPALEVLEQITPDDIVVYELSSFQLWDAEYSPHVAVVLPIEADHLNVHSDMDDYVAAKARIRLFQKPGEICIYHPTNSYSHKVATTGGRAENAVRYGIADDGQVYVEDGFFKLNDNAICSTEYLRLLGPHNLENACAAISAVYKFTHDAAAIERGLQGFEGLPHRLEFVRDNKNISYYNDSFSSAPGAAIAAINSFAAPKVLILGGKDKGSDHQQLIDRIASSDSIRALVLIGENRQLLAQKLQSAGIQNPVKIVDEGGMQQIVESATACARAGDVVLLSPACASFDMFKNFYDRGDQFRAVVKAL